MPTHREDFLKEITNDENFSQHKPPERGGYKPTSPCTKPKPKNEGGG